MSITYIEENTINSFYDLQDMCWSGAQQVLDIVSQHDLEDEFMEYLELFFNENTDYTSTEINDFIWFECDDWLDENIKHEGYEEDDN